MQFSTRSALVLVAALLLTAPAAAQDKESPIEKEVKAHLKDPTKPFVMLVRLKIKDGGGKKLESAFAKARAETRKEKGNKAYSLNRSTKAANEYLVYERWENFAALQAHLKAPYITTLLTQVGEVIDGGPEVSVFIPTRE